jgi:hypothetical protein
MLRQYLDKIRKSINKYFLGLSNGDYQTNHSIAKQRTPTVDLQISNGNEPVSNSTRLESLKLITEAFRRFANIETTLSTQRKQSQTVTRARFSSGTNGNHTKTNECILNQTQS